MDGTNDWTLRVQLTRQICRSAGPRGGMLRVRLSKRVDGGRDWIRTSVAVRREIYSLVDLTTLPPFHNHPGRQLDAIADEAETRPVSSGSASYSDEELTAQPLWKGRKIRRFWRIPRWRARRITFGQGAGAFPPGGWRAATGGRAHRQAAGQAVGAGWPGQWTRTGRAASAGAKVRAARATGAA